MEHHAAHRQAEGCPVSQRLRVEQELELLVGDVPLCHPLAGERSGLVLGRLQALTWRRQALLEVLEVQVLNLGGLQLHQARHRLHGQACRRLLLLVGRLGHVAQVERLSGLGLNPHVFWELHLRSSCKF